MLLRACVRNEVTRSFARSPIAAPSCSSARASCIADMKSSRPACTCCHDPASRRGRDAPHVVTVLRAAVSRTPVKNVSASCPRALATAVIVDEQRPARAFEVSDQHQRRARELAASFNVDEQRPARANPHACATLVCRRALPTGRDPRGPAWRGVLPLRAAPTSGSATSVILCDVAVGHAVLLEEIRHDARSLVAAGAHPTKRALVGTAVSRRDLRRRSRTVAQPQSPAAGASHSSIAGGGVTGRSQRRAALLGSVAS